MTRTLAQTVDIGHGRGRLAPEPAASIARIDAQLGRPADVNSAWRSPIEQQKAYDAWVAYSRYLAGGPWAPKAPRALPPSKSVHCDGEAADSDDWYNAQAAAVWRDGGWRQTARYADPKKDEPWHGEYFAHLDKLRNAPTGIEEDDMPSYMKAIDKRSRDLTRGIWQTLYTNEDGSAASIASGRCIVQSTAVVQLQGLPPGAEVQFRLVTTKAGTSEIRGGTTARESVGTPGTTYATVTDSIELTRPDDGVRWQYAVLVDGVKAVRTEVSAVVHPVK